MVTGSSSDETGGRRHKPSAPPLRYTEKFEELCAYYMSLGMSYHDYWDGDCCMVRYYRQMDEVRKERVNSEMWLQAAYIYEALLDASPVFNPLSRKNKPFPFRTEPFPITTAGSKQSEERKKKQRLEDGKEAMRRMMDVINKRFLKNKKKGGEVDEGS